MRIEGKGWMIFLCVCLQGAIYNVNFDSSLVYIQGKSFTFAFPFGLKKLALRKKSSIKSRPRKNMIYTQINSVRRFSIRKSFFFFFFC